MRFAIANCSQICAVTLNQVEEIDSANRPIQVELVEILSYLELYCLRPALERLHELTHNEVTEIGLSVVQLTLDCQKQRLKLRSVASELQLIEFVKRNHDATHSRDSHVLDEHTNGLHI